ncbi:MAG TPA: pectate lyase [Cellvibrio sp.]|mgnify:CR=1 FL=1|nr:pectate lyase [Cellvibrio sp.]
MSINLHFLPLAKLKVMLSGLIFLSSAAFAATGEELSKNVMLENAEWHAYSAKSEQLKALDKAALAAEVKALGLSEPKLPEYTKEFGFEPKQADEWFKSAEGERIMGIILSFQTPSGGWSKRTDMSKTARQKGQAFGVEENYVPTFDNNATSTQLQLLAQAYRVTKNKVYLSAFERGVKLIVDAQYPNGGWPQNYPIVGGYHDHITYNDNLMKQLMELLYNINTGKSEFSFTSKKLRKQTQATYEKGLACIKKTQVVTNGQLTIWGAQHDRVTLAPVKARNFEMASLSSNESAHIMSFLMDIDKPDADTIKAVHAAAKWFTENKVLGQRWSRTDLALQPDSEAPPMWSRFYEIGTNKPIFGDRDGSIYYSVAQVSEERRKGYAWYSTAANKILEKYKTWAEKYPTKP